MSRANWGSTSWGQLFTRAPAWSLTVGRGALSVVVDNVTYRIPIGAVTGFSVIPGLIWAQVTITARGQEPRSLDGIPNTPAKAMEAAVREALDVEIVRHLADALPDVRVWWALCANDLNQTRWISGDMVTDWLRQKPISPAVQDLIAQRNTRHYEKFTKACSAADQEALSWFFDDIAVMVAKRNREFLEKELAACKDFFERIEKKPLTEEQARAVVCFDNRIQLVASAGSGKTSTMVAKAGYVLHRGLFDANKILLLAFNAKAAEELRGRIRERLSAVKLPADAIRAQTFHAFGLRVIGEATGKKPTLAPWLDQGRDIEVLADIVDELKDRDPKFRSNWDLLRMVFGKGVDRFGADSEPEDWDRELRRGGYRTLNGEIVKSQEERMIADWLFYQGVRYEYERPYEVETTTADHGQYHPDFYYPDIGVYHEHFALDAQGRPPESFVGYANQVQWKRQLHVTHNTTLWETTSHTVRNGDAWMTLQQRLTEAGVTLDPNPDRPSRVRPAVSKEALLKTARTFLTHVKSNCLTPDDLLQRVRAEDSSGFPYRQDLFVRLFLLIWGEWEARLSRDNLIDFEDMLNLSAQHIEEGRWTSPFELVLVDEFQDASRARARLVRALVNRPHRYLCAVGDDWQSINRFAGADLSVMTQFESWFGPTTRMKLERTFRCPQKLCDVSSRFVQRNPAQIPKVVRSKQDEVGAPIDLIEVQDEDRITAGIEYRLRALYGSLSAGVIPKGRDGKVTVSILGRYNNDVDYFASRWQSEFKDLMTLDFKTVHASKGLEADYIILPRVVSENYGFPSQIEDDPVLLLAMPQGDTFQHAEERRLFYVALTRARRSVTVITVAHQQSEFVLELIRDLGVKPTTVDGEPSTTQICPKCGKGTLVTRHGPYGTFLGCNNFPACHHTVNPRRGRRPVVGTRKLVD